MATTIQIDGDQITLNDAASEDTLKDILKVLENQRGGGKKGVSTAEASQKNAAKAIEGAAKKLQGTTVNLSKYTANMDAIEKNSAKKFSNAMVGITKELKGVVKSTGSSISQLVRGPASFENLGRVAGDLVGSVGDLAQGMTDGIPILSTFGSAIKGATGIATMALGAAAAYAQNVTDGFIALSQAGANYNGDITKTSAEVRNIGLQLDSFTQIVQANAQGLAAFGGTVRLGTKRFVELTDVAQNEFGAELVRIGIHQAAQAEYMAEYISSQSRNLAFNRMSYQQQSMLYREYIGDLNKIVALTGKNRKQLSQEIAQMELRADAELALGRASQDAKEGLKAIQGIFGEGSAVEGIMMAGFAGRDLAAEIAAGTPGVKEFVIHSPVAAEKIRKWSEQLAKGTITQDQFLTNVGGLSEEMKTKVGEMQGLHGINAVATSLNTNAVHFDNLAQQLDHIVESGGNTLELQKESETTAEGLGGKFNDVLAQMTLLQNEIIAGISDGASELAKKFGIEPADEESMKTMWKNMRTISTSISEFISGEGTVFDQVYAAFDSFSGELRRFAADPLDWLVGGLNHGDIKDQIYDRWGGKKKMAESLGMSTKQLGQGLDDMSLSQLKDIMFEEDPAKFKKALNSNTITNSTSDLNASRQDNYSSFDRKMNSITDFENFLARGSHTWGSASESAQRGLSVFQELQKLHNAGDSEGVSQNYARLRKLLGPAVDEATQMENYGSFYAGGSNEGQVAWMKQNFRDAFNRYVDGTGMEALATGGPAGMGNPYLVGERGPELFIPGASGHVTETSSLATKSGSSNVIAALDRLNNTMNVVASNTGNNAQTEALSAQLATLRALVTTAKQSYRVSRDIRDYTV